jgi:hypothetical protein
MNQLRGGAHYQIVEEAYFTQMLDQFIKRHPRLTDVWRAVSWELSRDPFDGVPVPQEDEFFCYKSLTIGPVPSFYFVYKIDEPEKTLYFISLWPAQEVFYEAQTN